MDSDDEEQPQQHGRQQQQQRHDDEDEFEFEQNFTDKKVTQNNHTVERFSSRSSVRSEA